MSAWRSSHGELPCGSRRCRRRFLRRCGAGRTVFPHRGRRGRWARGTSNESWGGPRSVAFLPCRPSLRPSLCSAWFVAGRAGRPDSHCRSPSPSVALLGVQFVAPDGAIGVFCLGTTHDTQYAPGYSTIGFMRVRTGMSAPRVRELAGTPYTIPRDPGLALDAEPRRHELPSKGRAVS